MQAENTSRSSSNPAVYRVVLAGVLTSLTVLMALVPSVGLIPVPTPVAHATLLHIPAILAGILGGPIVGLLVSASFGVMSFLEATVPMFKDPLVAILPRLFIGPMAWLAYALCTGDWDLLPGRSSSRGVPALGLLSTSAASPVRASRWTLRVLAVIVAAIAVGFAWLVHGKYPVVGWIVLAAAVAAGAALLYTVERGDPRTVALAVSAVVGTFTNTSLVLTMAGILAYLPANVLVAAGVTNGIPEAIVAAVVVTAVVGAVRGTGRRQKSSL